MQNLLFRCLWLRHAILGGLAHSEFGKLSPQAVADQGAIAEWSTGLGDRATILPVRKFVVQGSVLPLLASFDQWVQGIYLPSVGDAVAGYQLDGDHPKQFSGRYRLEIAVPI
ncbi:MAG: hypothetical protein KME15_18160 [Drouetiella hepatica Uher 2000/2452]|jgi:hypothetical protein|uniref:Uncharacterized protein n=1 Tax=Drouetiella hepatica Uher 2000/2452 TaxID=904376 RepID=A0A951QF05_9CYAN|nr:hypothetical protein [Drouetiella hepatica Uher 2000/2452]